MNTTKFNLASLARWYALVRESKQPIIDDVQYISSKPNYVRKWILDGVGKAHAKVLPIDIANALQEAKLDSDIELDEFLKGEGVIYFLQHCYNISK